MHTLPTHRRILILTEGRLGIFTSKSAAALLRYRARDILGLVDSSAAGRELAELLPGAPSRPIFATLAAALPQRPDALYVGVAPVGGQLPAQLRTAIAAALDAGLPVVSGLHEFLADDREFAALAAHRGVAIHDLRRPVGPRTVATGRAAATRARRVLTVGSDCNVGKMFTAMELVQAARRRGRTAQMAATGQTGIMLTQRGVVVDAVVADFAAGAVEELVRATADTDLCIIEGQGSIDHVGFSGVTLAILHGACPDALVLVHHVGREQHRAPPHDPLTPLTRLRQIYEDLAALRHPARVVGVALNCAGVQPERAAEAQRAIERELDLPAVDPSTGAIDRLADAILGV